MATYRADDIEFHFQTNLAVSKYDAWDHYRQVLVHRNWRAVDLIAIRQGLKPPCCWLIEAKDFRRLRGVPGAKNSASELPQSVASKALDTASGLAEAAVAATNEKERSLAIQSQRTPRFRIVLHMEPFVGRPSKLFPAMPNPANIQQRLRQLVKSLDPNPLVLSVATTAKAKVPWSTTGL